MTRQSAPETYLALLVGALIATSCGLCTVAAGAWTLPVIALNGADGIYAMMFLVPSLVIGGLATWLGAYVFRSGHRALKPEAAARRASDRFASAATFAAGTLFGLAWLTLAVRALAAGLDALRNPQPYGDGSEWIGMVFWVAFTLGGAALGAWIAWGGLRRLRMHLRADRGA